MKQLSKIFVFTSMLTYISSLFLPYYIIAVKNGLKSYNGLSFVVPLYTILLLVPIYFLLFRSNQKFRFLPLVLSILVAGPVTLIQFILIDLNKYQSENFEAFPFLGFYLHVLTAILLLIISTLHIKKKFTPEESDLLDQIDE